MLTQLLSHALEQNFVFNPQIIIADFELAFLNAAKEMFPNARVKGCLFHFTQSSWKQTVLRGLKRQYNEIPEVRTFVQKLLSLPFIPLEDIMDVFNKIVANIPETDDEAD